MSIFIQTSTESSFRGKYQYSKKQFSTLANCSTSNCRYCLYRPACVFYHSWLPTNLQTNDVVGKLINTKRFLNGNVNVTLEVDKRLISIVEIEPSLQ